MAHREFKPFGLLLILFLLFEVPGVARPLARFEFSEVHMGTEFRLVLYAADGETARRASRAVFQEVSRLDAVMSDYNQASELNRLCLRGVNRKTKISADLFRVLAASQRLAAETGGAFDVTVGTVVRLWRRARRTGEMPAEADLTRARALTGYRALRLEARTRTAWLERDGVRLDLGGIAKGYAADVAMRIIKQFGIRRALVAAGGDILVSDAPPGKPGWTITVATADPRPERPSLVLTNAAVSTSGDAEQFVEIGGTRYSHIVDPRTGIGLIGRRSVTVVAPRSTEADSLATALSVIGGSDWPRVEQWLRQKRGVAALMLFETGQGFAALASRRWQTLMKQNSVDKPASPQPPGPSGKR